MPETKRPLKVFLCHASQDKPVVRELSGRLASEGWIDPWVDEKKLLPGQDWRTKIEEAVETSDIVIICLSNNSVTKEGYVQKELRYAREIALEKPEETIFLVPLRLDDCEVPRGLRFYQWVDYFGEKKEESYSALIESLKLRYEQKLIHEEAERARKEKLEREIAERIAQEKASREKAEKEAAEKARLEADELARQKTEKEKAERETAEKVAREKAEKDAAEKARLESEKRARQKTSREKPERDAAAKEKVKQETAKKPKPRAVKHESVEDKPAQKEAETQVSQHKSGNQIVFWVVGLVVVVALVIGLSSLDGNPPPLSTPTSTIAPFSELDAVTATNTISPSKTPTQAFTQTFTPSPVPSVKSSEKIVFVSDRDGNEEIYIMNSDGNNQIRLTDYAGRDFYPQWSPDGTKIAFLSERENTTGLYVMDIDGGNQRMLASPVQSGDGEFDWSPDSTRLVYSSYDGQNNDISVISIDGENRINLTNTPSETELSPSWSPDGTKIAFFLYYKEYFIMNSDGTNLVKVSDSWDLDWMQPQWAPNSSYLLINTYYKIFRVNKNTNELVQLSDNSIRNYYPIWSPDSTRIAFTAHFTGGWEIYTMNVGGSDVTQITNVKNPRYYLSNLNWSPDGTKIVFHCNDSKSSFIMSVELETGKSVILSKNENYNDRSPDLAP